MSHFLANLKNVLFIDIETVSGSESFHQLPERMRQAWIHKASLIDISQSPEALYFKKAAIYAEFGRIISIGLGFFFYDENKELNIKLKCLYGDDEKKLLQEFIGLLESGNSNKKIIFCAHNGKEFDYPYLCRRMLIHKLNTPRVLDLMNKKPWEVSHYDTLEMWKFGDRKNYTSLDLLATVFDIPGSKGEMDGSMVNEVYYKENDLEKIARYCTEDVLVTAQVFLRLNNKPLISEAKIHKAGFASFVK